MAKTRKRIRAAGTKVRCKLLNKSDIEAAKTAYADVNMPWEQGELIRKLHWKGTADLSAASFCQLATAAVKSYNEFDAKKVCAIFRRHPKLCMRLAREGSVAVYVRGSKSDLEKIKAKQEDLMADEASISRGRLRLWWD